MKFRILLLFIVASVFSFKANSQTNLKIAHVNVQELVQMHPAIDSIHAVLEQERKDMEEIYAEMLEEQERKLNAFESESPGYSETIKKAKQEEMLLLSQKIQNYNQSAQQLIRQRNMTLIQPVYEAVNEAIAEICAAENLTYALDISTGTVAFIAKDALDITPLVKEKLGIK